MSQWYMRNMSNVIIVAHSIRLSKVICIKFTAFMVLSYIACQSLLFISGFVTPPLPLVTEKDFGMCIRLSKSLDKFLFYFASVALQLANGFYWTLELLAYSWEITFQSLLPQYNSMRRNKYIFLHVMCINHNSTLVLTWIKDM